MGNIFSSDCFEVFRDVTSPPEYPCNKLKLRYKRASCHFREIIVRLALAKLLRNHRRGVERRVTSEMDLQDVTVTLCRYIVMDG